MLPLNIQDIRPNPRKRIIAIETTEPLDDATVAELSKIEYLEAFPVSCYLPNSELYCSANMAPISLDTDLASLLTEINHQNDVLVTKIDRLKKRDNNSWVDSLTIKLMFKPLQHPDCI